MEYVKIEDVRKHEQECDCGFVIELAPDYHICTKPKQAQKQAKAQTQAQEPDSDEIIWF